MFKIKFILLILFLSITFNCKAGIIFSAYDTFVNYYENNIDKTNLVMLEDARKQGVTYQEFFDFQLIFTDFILFSSGSDCRNYPDDEYCLKRIAKVEASISELEFFAKYNNQPLDTSKFKIWKENALRGKATFDLSENSKDLNYSANILFKMSGGNTTIGTK